MAKKPPERLYVGNLDYDPTVDLPRLDQLPGNRGLEEVKEFDSDHVDHPENSKPRSLLGRVMSLFRSERREDLSTSDQDTLIDTRPNSGASEPCGLMKIMRRLNIQLSIKKVAILS